MNKLKLIFQVHVNVVIKKEILAIFVQIAYQVL